MARLQECWTVSLVACTSHRSDNNLCVSKHIYYLQAGRAGDKGVQDTSIHDGPYIYDIYELYQGGYRHSTGYVSELRRDSGHKSNARDRAAHEREATSCQRALLRLYELRGRGYAIFFVFRFSPFRFRMSPEPPPLSLTLSSRVASLETPSFGRPQGD